MVLHQFLHFHFLEGRSESCQSGQLPKGEIHARDTPLPGSDGVWLKRKKKKKNIEKNK